jgi:hypothetical protein
MTQLTAESVKRIREAYGEAIGAPVTPEDFAAAFDLPAAGERDGVTGAAALALRYVSQGLPGFRGKLNEWSFQGLVGHHGPHQVLCRFWWPRFVAEIEFGHATSLISHVHWIDDPGDLRIPILIKACTTFRLALPEETKDAG